MAKERLTHIGEGGRHYSVRLNLSSREWAISGRGEGEHHAPFASGLDRATDRRRPGRWHGRVICAVASDAGSSLVRPSSPGLEDRSPAPPTGLWRAVNPVQQRRAEVGDELLVKLTSTNLVAGAPPVVEQQLPIALRQFRTLRFDLRGEAVPGSGSGWIAGGTAQSLIVRHARRGQRRLPA